MAKTPQRATFTTKNIPHIITLVLPFSIVTVLMEVLRFSGGVMSLMEVLCF